MLKRKIYLQINPDKGIIYSDWHKKIKILLEKYFYIKNQ
jgi:hypothetical protein